MGKTENSFDLFEFDHSKYQTEQAEETVTEGTSGVEVIDQGPSGEASGDAIVEVPVEEIKEEDVVVAEGEETITEEKDAKKQVEKEGTSEEDALAASDSDEIGGELVETLNSLIESDVLVYDEDKEYEASPEGIKQLIEETVAKKAESALTQYKESLPDNANELIGILEKGGTVQDFIEMSQQTNFADVPIYDGEGNSLERNQTYLVEDYLELVLGYDKDEIDETVEGYKEGGLLEKQAAIAQKKLARWQSDKNDALVRQREADKLAAEQLATEQADAFRKSVIDKREIAGFKLTKQKAEQLYDYITKPIDKEGKTKFAKDDTEETRLLYALMAMEGFDKSKLSKEIETKQAITLKKKLSNYKDSQAAPKRGGEQIIKKQTSDVVKGIKWDV